MSENETYKPKIRVVKRQLNRLCSWYTEQLTIELGNRILSPATQLLIERRLQQIQEQQKRMEPQNTLWTIPVKPVYHLVNDHSFEVIIADPEAILITDFDSRGY